MLNLLDLFKKTVKTSIEDKTLPSSISRFNVGQRIKDLADQTMRVPLLQVLPNVFYPLGFKGRDADFNEYIAIVDNVNGDYNDSAKWKPSGGGAGDFASLTGSPYDNVPLGNALNSKQDRINGIVSGCEITVETFAGIDTNKRIRVSKGAAATNTWYISPNEYSKLADTVSSEITLCVTGGDFKYYDVVADNTGAITIHEGTPSTSPSHYVVNPLFEVLLGFVTVGDAVIEEPIPIIGSTSLQDAYDTGRYVDIIDNEPIEFFGNDNFKGRDTFLEYKWELKGNGDFSTKGVINEHSSSTTLLAGYATNINATNVVYVTGSGITVNGFQGCITFLTSPRSHTGSKRTVIFDGVNTLVNGSGFYLLTGANITTASGDKAVFISTFANGWEMVDYVRYDGTALSGGSLTQASQSQVEAAFDNTDQTTPVVLEQTSALTPFNAWWLVQKIKAFFSTTANQTDSTNKRFVTDAEKVVIGNTSNTNTGDETTSSIQSKRPLKTINTQNLEGLGDLTITGFTAASVEEVNTGTENAKGATPLNLETSKYLNQNGSKTYATTGGTSTAYTLALSPAITAYVAGQQFNVAAHTTNTTTTPTINVSGLGAKNIVDKYGNAIVVGDFQGNVIIRYNGTSFNIVSGTGTNEVTNAKAAQMAANTIKANNTGSTANAADITTDQFTAMMEIAVAVGTAGIITGMTSATYKYIRLTSASATGLGSIVAPSSSYKDLYIWNDTGATLTLYHDYSSEATAANRILCGANRSWANNTMLHLKYDVTEARWCTVVQDGNIYRPLLAGTGTRINQTDSNGYESAVLTTQNRDFTPAQQASADGGSWSGVSYITITGLKVGQVYQNNTTEFRYSCEENDKCIRISTKAVTTVRTNLIYPCTEITATSGTLIVDNAFVLNNASQVVMNLPSTATQGDMIFVNGKGAGGGRISQNASQQIVGGTTNTTVGTGGYITFGQYAAITLKCITGGASSVWEIVSINPVTTLTIV